VHNDADKAISLLNEALKCNPAHGAASVAIAKIHLARFDLIALPTVINCCLAMESTTHFVLCIHDQSIRFCSVGNDFKLTNDRYFDP
jgi:hypothetical protein